MSAASPPLQWRQPSRDDSDRAEILEPVAQSIEDAFEFVEPVSGGRLRGILLHKLMEEFLNGELDERDHDQVEERACALLDELTGFSEEPPPSIPYPSEMARTASRTLAFKDIAALRPYLVAEVPIWSASEESLTTGRADAVAVKRASFLRSLIEKATSRRATMTGHITRAN